MRTGIRLRRRKEGTAQRAEDVQDGARLYHGNIVLDIQNFIRFSARCLENHHSWRENRRKCGFCLELDVKYSVFSFELMFVDHYAKESSSLRGSVCYGGRKNKTLSVRQRSLTREDIDLDVLDRREFLKSTRKLCGTGRTVHSVNGQQYCPEATNTLFGSVFKNR